MSRRQPAAKRGCAVVLDTGLVLRALLRGDEQARALRQSWQSGACQPLLSPGLAQGLLRALAFPALGLSAAQQQELLADYLPYASVVAEPATGPRVRGLKPLQDLALQLALTAPARFLLSDCSDFPARFERARSAVSAASCKVLSSAEFLASL